MTVLVFLSLVMMITDHRQHHLEGVRSVLSLAIYPLQLLVNAPVALLRDSDETLTMREKLVIENRALKRQQLLDGVKLQRLTTLEEENRRLRTLLQSTRSRWLQVMIAEPFALDLDPTREMLQINKGSRHGVFRNQAVLDAHGVLGQVYHTSAYSSTIILITDPNHSIPVRISRNGLHTIALGSGDATELLIPHITNSADVQAGDLLVTSGLGQTFPPGYPVAVITRVIKNLTRQYAEVIAEPTALIQNIQELLLVWHKESQREEAATLPETTEIVNQ
ncbi:MAG: rod shape-determining protein MreC [Gammaproteobacteria bacterium]|nr:rod shape-determining protein MreC [Gammaproteobacteria bacterium]